MEKTGKLIRQSQHELVLNIGIKGWQSIVRYLNEADLGKDSIARYRVGLRKYIEFIMSDGVSDLEDCTVSHVIRYKQMLSEMNIATNTKNLYLQGVKSFYEWRGLVGGRDLASGVKKFNHVKCYSKDAISVDEWRKVLSAIDCSRNNRSTYIGRRDYAIVSILFLTGMRQMSLQNLRWQDLVMYGTDASGNMRVAFKYKRKCKGEDFGLVVLSKELISIVNDWNVAVRERYDVEQPDGSWFIFGDRDTKVHNSYLRKLVTDRLKDAGVYCQNTKTGHSLRHGLAEHLIDSGMSLQSVADVLGHSSTNSTKFYTHKKEKIRSMDEASSVLNKLFV